MSNGKKSNLMKCKIILLAAGTVVLAASAVTLVLSLSASCSTHSDDCLVLDVDTDNVMITDLSDKAYASVKFISDYAIGQIDRVAIYDTLALIKASGSLYGFNTETGGKIAKYSNKGRAAASEMVFGVSGL